MVDHHAHIFLALRPLFSVYSYGTTSIPPKSTTTVFECQTHPKFVLNLFSHTNHTVDWQFAPASLECFEIISKPFWRGRLGSPFRNQTMDGQTSGPPKPFLDFVLHAYFQQLEVSTESFNQKQTRLLIASWQRQGRTKDEIYDELEVMFPYHGYFLVPLAIMC
jgi:hypothetical protein